MARRRPTIFLVKPEYAGAVRQISTELGLKWVESPSTFRRDAIQFKWMMTPDQEDALISAVPREAHALTAIIRS